MAKTPALGSYGRRVLRESGAAPLRLVGISEGYPPCNENAAVDITRVPAPAPDLRLGDPASARRVEVATLRAQLADAQERIRDLEHALEVERRRNAAAVEEGARSERARNAKTHGGRLPSILTSGK